MTRALGTAIVIVLFSPAASYAHRLDEYLQATRVSLARDGVTLEIDLTPGATIASTILELLDRDHDGAISPLEAESYGRHAISELELQLDGARVALALSRIEIPPIPSIRDGMGTIQMYATGTIESISGGRRHLHLRNNHHPVPSVYLVNALVPDDRGIGVVAQIRDPLQQSVRIDYTVRPRWFTQLVWMTLVGTGMPGLLWLARSSRSRRGMASTA